MNPEMASNIIRLAAILALIVFGGRLIYVIAVYYIRRKEDDNERHD